jgi:hypothetical protein
MKRRQMYRGVEDPISGTFNLAEEISERSEKIIFLSRFALYFVWFSIILYSILALASVVQGNIFMLVIWISLLITGILTTRLLSSLRTFLKTSTFRYSAIKAMREGPPAYSIPEGKNKTERFLEYLQENNRTFLRMLKNRPEILRKDSYAVGKKGNRYHFDAFIQKRPSSLHKLLGIGYPGYSIYIREFKKSPEMDDLKALIRELDDITANGKAYPHRVIMLMKGGRSYSGIDEDVYDKLTEGNIWLKGHKDKKINLQVVVELPTGHYEFIPFIPELPNILP